MNYDPSFGSNTASEASQISNEHISHLVFRTEPEEIKYPMYRSKFSDTVKQEMRMGKQCHQTMGWVHGFGKASPEKYLKKHTRVECKALVEKDTNVKKKVQVMPDIPKKEDWASAPPRVEQNYILTNIKAVANAIPLTGPSRAFDTALGRRVHNCNLFIPKFAWSESFGKVPAYLEKIKKGLDAENKCPPQESETVPTKPEEKQGSTKIDRRIKVISAEEKDEILKNLKEVWAELQREFQLLPFLNDTPPKIKKKETMERRLNEIERDIKMVEENDKIFVIQDPNDPRCNKQYQLHPCLQK